MLARQSNAGRMFGPTVVERHRPKWTGPKDLRQSSVSDNESAVHTKHLCSNKVYVSTQFSLFAVIICINSDAIRVR